MPQAVTAATAQVVGSSPLRVWSLPSDERLRRQFAKAGTGAGHHNERTALFRADWVFDDSIVLAVVRAGDDVALVVDGECVAVNVPSARTTDAMAHLGERAVPPLVPARTIEQLTDGYNDVLRKKREVPLLMHLTPEALPAIERRVFGASYKGVTDIVTLYAWPAPARVVTRWCAGLGITPNQVTSASLVLVLATVWLFWTGHYAWGIACAWPMTFLDTVDGKLARVTVNSSAFGNVFDHGIDLVHPPFWWWAWIVGLSSVGLPLADPRTVLTVIVAGYILQRLEEGVFIACFKMEMHVWTWFDSKFRLITARRNPNLLILMASVPLGRPDLGILAVAAWTVVCFVVHLVRIGQAAFARRKGPLRSWLAA